MAAGILYPNGIGGSTGDELCTLSDLYTSGAVWYVGPGGSDAAGPRGKERERPLATLAQAHTNASAGDIIVCLEGHAETLAASQAFNKAGVVVLGEGSGSTRPRFTCNGGVALFNVSVAGVRFHNIYFPASTVVPTCRVQSSGTGTAIVGCYFECGTLDTEHAVKLVTGAGNCIVRDTTFVSTSNSVASQPAGAIEVVNAMSDLWLSNVTLDGGTAGWSEMAFLATGAVTRFLGSDVDLLNNSDAQLTGSTGHFWPRNTSGSSRVVWTS